ncbi:MAG TPA: HPr family phosphocarrier protein [Epsilonproteobacteria bacterium]|nr:HPr family phosphocarrier protein [Campylobacterota bacterium]HHD79055.1 HPr family phosphocarrier protein [Campylobacterota bacterium]
MLFFKNLFAKPLTSTLTVTSNNGFHLRPVAKFVSEAKKFDCEINASFHNKSVSAKAVNALLSLGLDKEDSFVLELQGKDASKALTTLRQVFATLMQDDEEVEHIVNTQHDYEGEALLGESIYQGLAIAPLYHYTQEESYIKNNATFQGSVVHAMSILSKRFEESTQKDIANIYLAQKELLSQLSAEVHDIDTFSALIDKEIKTLKGSKLESKAVDYQDLLRLVKSNLGYTYQVHLPSQPFILLAKDLLPSDIKQLETSSVQGVILTQSSLTSHTAILLRSAGITSLILPEDIHSTSDDVILDTYAGVLIHHPTPKDLETATKVQTLHHRQEILSQEKRFEPAITKNKKTIHVYANITDVTSASAAKEAGAEGIGLLRTEFLFGQQAPSLETQTKAYEAIFACFDDVTVRTLDVGGDKALPYISLPKEENPFLGVRGVRLFQSHPDILEAQLHAIFLAAKGKSIKIMFPMVSSVEEFTHAKNFALHVAKKYQLTTESILFGMMIEVPSVLFDLKTFNEAVDFYSVGTNDLTQYLFAIERTHPTLKTDALSPVVFKALYQIVTQVTKPVSICGELAANIDAIPKLIQLGYTSLSVTPKSIAQTKETIRHV